VSLFNQLRKIKMLSRNFSWKPFRPDSPWSREVRPEAESANAVIVASQGQEIEIREMDSKWLGRTLQKVPPPAVWSGIANATKQARVRDKLLRLQRQSHRINRHGIWAF
jgi:hypothetical protein